MADPWASPAPGSSASTGRGPPWHGLTPRGVDTAEEAERRHIADALHDRALQDLISIALRADLAARRVPSAAEELRALRSAVTDVAETLRSLLFELSPDSAGATTLSGTFATLAAEITRSSDVTFNVVGRVAVEPPADARHVLYRTGRRVIAAALDADAETVGVELVASGLEVAIDVGIHRAAEAATGQPAAPRDIVLDAVDAASTRVRDAGGWFHARRTDDHIAVRFGLPSVVVPDRADEPATRPRLGLLEVLDQLGELVTVHAVDGTVLHASKGVLAITGSCNLDAMRACVAPDDLPALDRAFEAWRRGATDRVRVRLSGGHAGWRHCEVAGWNLLHHPDVLGIVVALRDVSARVSLQDELRYRSTHDGLTGLDDRARFVDHVDQALARSTKTGDCVAVIQVGLDEFDDVNDRYGHGAGDEVLVAAADLIRATLGPGDTIARISGAEFAVCVEGLHSVEQARLPAQALRAALAAPFGRAGTAVELTTSVGIVVARGTASTADVLLRDAGTAMRAAERHGGDRTELFVDELRGDLMRHGTLRAELRTAMASGAVWVAYQPQVRLRSGEIIGLEALARWDHPTLGSISPSEFIPVAEESGLIFDLGRFVLQRACADLARMRASSARHDLLVTVNLSPRQLEDPRLVRLTRQLVDEHGLRDGGLCLELTEGALMEGPALAESRLRALHAAGARLAVDDFGTGYSALARLRRLPLHQLKIDGGFVRGLGRNAEDTAIVTSIIDLARKLELDVLGEGVEDPQDRDGLYGRGCDLGQGFLWSPAVPADDIVALLTRGSEDQWPGATSTAPESASDRQSVDDIVSVLRHELATPVTAIRWSAELLERVHDGRSGLSRDDVVHTIASQAKELTALVLALTDIKAVGHGSVPLSITSVDVESLLRVAAGRLADALDGREVRIDVVGRRCLRADSDRLEQVVVNLLSNAARFGPRQVPIDIRSASSDDTTRITIADRGAGVPAWFVSSLFRQFSRLGRAGPGLGLGLYLSRHIARAHGGDLEYAPRPGGGAEFTLTLPHDLEGVHP